MGGEDHYEVGACSYNMNQADYIIITGIILSKSRKYHHLLEIMLDTIGIFIFCIYCTYRLLRCFEKLFMPCKIKKIYIFSVK